MAANVFATPGSLYLTPTTATTGGTLISGVEEQNISLSLDVETRLRRTGVGTSSGMRVRHGRVQAARLIVPLREQSTTALKILFSHLTTDGATHQSYSGTAAAEFSQMPSFTLVLRPASSGEKHIYCPNWRMTDESAQLVLHSQDTAQLTDAVLVLVATKPTDATGDPYMWASSSAIDTAYGLAVP